MKLFLFLLVFCLIRCGVLFRYVFIVGVRVFLSYDYVLGGALKKSNCCIGVAAGALVLTDLSALFLRAAQALIILLCTSCSKLIQCTRSSLERKQPTQKPFGPD